MIRTGPLARIEPVEVSDWAVPIVPVIKSDKSSIRICGQPSIEAGLVPITNGERPLCQTGRRTEVHKAA